MTCILHYALVHQILDYYCHALGMQNPTQLYNKLTAAFLCVHWEGGGWLLQDTGLKAITWMSHPCIFWTFWRHPFDIFITLETIMVNQ